MLNPNANRISFSRIVRIPSFTPPVIVVTPDPDPDPDPVVVSPLSCDIIPLQYSTAAPTQISSAPGGAQGSYSNHTDILTAQRNRDSFYVVMPATVSSITPSLDYIEEIAGVLTVTGSVDLVGTSATRLHDIAVDANGFIHIVYSEIDVDGVQGGYLYIQTVSHVGLVLTQMHSELLYETWDAGTGEDVRRARISTSDEAPFNMLIAFSLNGDGQGG